MNVANFISDFSRENSGKPAIVSLKDPVLGLGKKKREVCTFDELDKKINIYANSFVNNGILKTQKVLVFIPPSIELMSSIFALFKIGATPILIDPGMGVDHLVKHIETVQADALIGISKSLYLKKLKGKFFKTVKTSINVDGKLLGTSLDKIIKDQSNEFIAHDFNKDELAAILFTSGATGPAKGVEYTMGMFVSQTKQLKSTLNLVHSDRDLSGFPLFALFSLCMGLTTYITPSIDASKPAATNPKKLVNDLIENKITFANGSPSIWKTLIPYLKNKKKNIKTLKKLATFGAPVSHDLLRQLKEVLPDCEIYTPYGATESLPISNISSTVILGESYNLTTKGRGVCVGYPLSGVKVRIDGAKNFHGHPAGELLVKSDMTSLNYYENPEVNSKTKIKINDEHFHRIGDMGYFDDWGRLWYLGRQSHTIYQDTYVLYPISFEGVINAHSKVKKSALIQVEDQACMAIICQDDLTLGPVAQESFFNELRVFSKKLVPIDQIKKFFLVESFPVDIRHNIKIDRPALGDSLTGSED